jgi:hypothetical protein
LIARSGFCGSDGVVPVAVPVVAVERELVYLLVGDLLAGGVPVGVVGGLDLEAALGGGAGDELDDGARSWSTWKCRAGRGTR